jgi:phytoene dehydrogenase-like protein
MSSIVIIGGGHNALVAAFYLAKSGHRPIVLERRETVGGGAITEELHPGFRCPTLAHHVGPLWTGIVRDMDLARHGVEFLVPATQVFAPGPDGRALVLHDDVRRSAHAIQALSTKDAAAFPLYRESMTRVSGVLASLLATSPPRIDQPTGGDLWNLLRVGRKFRALGRKDGYRLLRWSPMAVADLVHEWFESDLLCATLAAPGVSGTMFGPRSAGSALMLMLQEAHQRLGGHLSRVRGGPGALTQGMANAATSAGATIRTRTNVERVVVRGGRVTGVALAGGEQVDARAVVSGVDPKTTFLRLVDPIDLTPDFLAKIGNYRAAGTVAKVNLALSALPKFQALPANGTEALSGRIHIGPEIDYHERAVDHAKYGEFSSEPWLDITIPSILDPQLAPAGAHVMSIYAHYAPATLRGTTWDASQEAFGNTVLHTLARHAPGIEQLVVAGQVITPAELDVKYGFFGGHVYHGELALDQLLTMRPLLGYGQYRSPIDGLYLCSAGTHPGGFMTGGSGFHAVREILKDLRS